MSDGFAVFHMGEDGQMTLLAEGTRIACERFVAARRGELRFGGLSVYRRVRGGWEEQ